MEDSTATPAPSGTTPPDSPRTFNERFAQYKQGFESTHPHAAEATSSAFQVAHAPLADGVSEVNIFDFDGTLFRSPEPNFTKWSSEAVGKLKGHPRDRGLGWFQEVITLSAPYVPVAPGEEWWNQQLVKRVRESMASESAVTVLLTGRTESYRENIQTLISHLNLAFDVVGLKSPPEMKTMEFKKEFIDGLVAKYKPRKINMWEDRPNHLEEFSRFLLEKKQLQGIDFEVHFVEMPPHFLPEEKEREVIDFLMNKHGREYIIKDIVEYTGVLLDRDSHRKLINAFPPKARWAKKAHHMTMCLGEMREDLFTSVDKELYALGREVELEVVAYGEDEKAAAVKVTSDVPTLNTTPHVTVAISPIGRAKDSNDIRAWRPVRVTGQTYPEEEPQEEKKAEDNAATVEGEAQEAAAAVPLEPIWVDHKIVLKGKIFQNVRLHIGAKPKPQAPKLVLNFGKIIGKHHPDIKGPQIGKMVVQVKQWTLETGTADEVLIEEFIKNLTIS